MTRHLKRGLLAAAVATAGVLAAASTAAAQGPIACSDTFDVPAGAAIGSVPVTAGTYRITVLTPDTLDCAQAAGRLAGSLNTGPLVAPWTFDPATWTFWADPGSGFQIAAAGNAGPTPCPGAVHVLHNDRIGAFAVPAGWYAITMSSTPGLTCSQASARFLASLNDFDGRLPSPWTLDPATGTFQRGAGGPGFRVSPTQQPTAGGGSATTGRPCPGTFNVDHDDRVGALRMPAGRYQVTSLGTSCRVSMRRLGQFLRLPSGRLPAQWKLTPATGTFSTVKAGFRVKRVS
jgi:hypothetical protein